MSRFLIIVTAALAAVTEIVLSKSFSVEKYKSSTSEVLAAEDGTSTCRGRV